MPKLFSKPFKKKKSKAGGESVEETTLASTFKAQQSRRPDWSLSNSLDVDGEVTGKGLLCPCCKEGFGDENGLCQDCTGHITFVEEVGALGAHFAGLDADRQKRVWPQGYWTYIGGVDKGSVAEQAGLFPGLFLAAVNGKSTRWKERSDAVAMVKASANTKRTITFTNVAEIDVFLEGGIETVIQDMTKLAMAENKDLRPPEVDVSDGDSAGGSKAASPSGFTVALPKGSEGQAALSPDSSQYSSRVARAKEAAARRASADLGSPAGSPPLSGPSAMKQTREFVAGGAPMTPRGMA